MGVVIGETAIVGDDVTLYQGVTLGVRTRNRQSVIRRGDDDCCTVAPLEVESSSDASNQPAEGPAVVEGTNDREYVPSTFVPYQLHEGMQELAAMRGIAAAQAGQAQGNFKATGSLKPVLTTSTLPAQNAKNGTRPLQPIVVKQETVAEAAREIREKHASGEKPEVIVTPDASGALW